MINLLPRERINHILFRLRDEGYLYWVDGVLWFNRDMPFVKPSRAFVGDRTPVKVKRTTKTTASNVWVWSDTSYYVLRYNQIMWVMHDRGPLPLNPRIHVYMDHDDPTTMQIMTIDQHRKRIKALGLDQPSFQTNSRYRTTQRDLKLFDKNVVINLRNQYRHHPTPLVDLAQQWCVDYQITFYTLTRALTGITWSTLNSVCQPIPLHLFHEPEPPQITTEPLTTSLPKLQCLEDYQAWLQQTGDCVMR